MFKNKKNFFNKRIISFLVGTTLLLIGIGIFGLINKVQADTDSYVPVPGEAFEKKGAIPTTPTDNVVPAEAGDYTNISSSNNAWWQTLSIANNDWDSQIYTFTIGQNINSISSLDFTWEGYRNLCLGFNVYFKIWNISNTQWDDLDSHDYLSEVDFTFNKNISANFANYIDGEGSLSLMVTSQRGKPQAETCVTSTECCSGSCSDGVCCDSDCDSFCENCNLSGTEGACTGVTADDYEDCNLPCTHCDENSNCTIWPNNTQQEECTSTCRACQDGVCSYAASETDPGEHCEEGVFVYNQGCMERIVDGLCNNSGECNPFGDGQATNTGMECLSGDYHCGVDNYYYSGYSCDADGTCSTDFNMVSCCVNSQCSVGEYCSTTEAIVTEADPYASSTHQCLPLPPCQKRDEDPDKAGAVPDETLNNTQLIGCNDTCQACQYGVCGYADSGTDPGNVNCDTGTTGALGCATGFCGDDGVCEAFNGGDGNCPDCWTCNTTSTADIVCIPYPDNTQDAGCLGFCQSCQEGICDSTDNGYDPADDCGGLWTGCSGQCIRTGEGSACNGSESCQAGGITEDVALGFVCVGSGSIVTTTAVDYCEYGEDCDDGDCSADKFWTSCEGDGTCKLLTEANPKEGAYIETVHANPGNTLTDDCAIGGISLCLETPYSAYYKCNGVCIKGRDEYRCTDTHTCEEDVGDDWSYLADGKVCSNGAEITPSASTNCNISIYCTYRACSASKYYLGCDEGTSNCTYDGKVNYGTWYAASNQVISESSGYNLGGTTCADNYTESCVVYHDPGSCKKCNGSGGCISATTGWGDNYYNCENTNWRCVSGICTACEGWVYDDGCDGCAGQGGKGCWYLSGMGSTCDSACSAHGGCVDEDWNDNTSCTVGEHFDDCSGACNGDFSEMSPSSEWGLLKYCYYRAAHWTAPGLVPLQCCSGNNGLFKYRTCVCDH